MTDGDALCSFTGGFGAEERQADDGGDEEEGDDPGDDFAECPGAFVFDWDGLIPQEWLWIIGDGWIFAREGCIRLADI